MTDEFYDELPTYERSCSPIHANMTKHSMLNFIPLARSRRVMRDLDRKIYFISKFLKFFFPKSASTRITTSTICSNVQTCGFGVSSIPNPLPPTTNCFDCKLCGVMVNSNGNKPFVFRNVVNPIWNRFAKFFVYKIVNFDICRLSFR